MAQPCASSLRHCVGVLVLCLSDVERPDVLCQVALGALHELEFNPAALAKCSETFHLNSRKVREHVGTPVRGLNEAKTLGIVKPFDRTEGHQPPLPFQR